MDIEKLITMMQQLELLNSLEDSVSYGQTPSFMLQDRSATQGAVSQDSLFDAQGANIPYSNKNINNFNYENIPSFERPASEETSVSFSDFFGNPQYNFEQSIMIPKQEDIDD